MVGMSVVDIVPFDAFCRGYSRKRRNPFSFEDQLLNEVRGLRGEFIPEFSDTFFPVREFFYPVIKRLCASPSTCKSKSNGNMKVKSTADKKNNFCIELKVESFHPEEITVKVKEGLLTVHAKHEESSEEDGAYLFQELRREFILPQDVNPEQVISRLTSDGMLQISAPRLPGAVERLVPICKDTSDTQEPNPMDEQTNGDDRRTATVEETKHRDP